MTISPFETMQQSVLTNSPTTKCHLLVFHSIAFSEQANFGQKFTNNMNNRTKSNRSWR